MARQPTDYGIDVVRVSPLSSAKLVRTGPATAVPETFTATVTLDEGRLSVMVLVAVASSGQAQVVELVVRGGPTPGGADLPAVTTSALRRILVDQVLRAVLIEATVPAAPEDQMSPLELDNASAAAKHYREALAAGSKSPTIDVADMMGVSRSQASRYVRAARDAGLLPPAGPGGNARVPYGHLQN